MVSSTTEKYSNPIATWFGEKERTTATAIATLSNQLGSAVGFFLAPAIVNASSVPMLLIVEAAEAAFILVWTIIYFPDKPPSPPSASAASADQVAASTSTFANFRKEGTELLTNRSFLVLAIIAGWQAGMFNAWTGMFDIILSPEGYSDAFSGWLGFASTLAGIVGGIAIGFAGDTIFKGKFKLLLFILLIASVALLTLFTLSFPSFLSPHALIPNSNVSILISVTLGGLFLGSTNPIFYELAVEMTYPIAEGTSVGIITAVNNIACLVVLFVGPYVKYTWINGGVVLNIVLCTLALLFVRETYKRKAYENETENFSRIQ